MDKFDPKGPITSSAIEQCMAHRGIMVALLAELVKKKVVNRQIIERRLLALIDTGPQAGMTPGVLEEIALVRHLMAAVLDDDGRTH